jgi:hypothetical protein
MTSRSAQIVSRAPPPKDLHSARLPPFDDDACRNGLRQQFEVAAAPRRLRIGQRCARSAAVGDVGIDSAEALRDIGIEVVDQGKPGLPSGGEKCVADR